MLRGADKLGEARAGKGKLNHACVLAECAPGRSTSGNSEVVGDDCAPVQLFREAHDVEHQQGSVMVDLVGDAVALHVDKRSCAPCQAFAATPTTRLADLLQQLPGERRKVRPLSLVLLDFSPAGTSAHGMPRLKARRSSQRFSVR